MNSADLQFLASAQGIILDSCLLKEYPLGTFFWALHHQTIAERLTEPLANRIAYILTEKPACERVIRCAALRPVLDQKAYDAACAKANAAYAKARARANAAYAKARARANAAYDKACARADAARDKTLLAQWGREYPDHPKWGENGLVF